MSTTASERTSKISTFSISLKFVERAAKSMGSIPFSSFRRRIFFFLCIHACRAGFFWCVLFYASQVSGCMKDAKCANYWRKRRQTFRIEWRKVWLSFELAFRFVWRGRAACLVQRASFVLCVLISACQCVCEKGMIEAKIYSISWRQLHVIRADPVVNSPAAARMPCAQVKNDALKANRRQISRILGVQVFSGKYAKRSCICARLQWLILT